MLLNREKRLEVYHHTSIGPLLLFLLPTIVMLIVVIITAARIGVATLIAQLLTEKITLMGHLMTDLL